MPRCAKCGKRFSLVDLSNHLDSHLSLAEWNRRVEQMVEEKRKNAKRLPPNKEVFAGLTDDEPSLELRKSLGRD